jgi:hypothetical protein
MKPQFALWAGLVMATSCFGQEVKSAKPTLPADLAAVPNDSLGFVHVKLADLWKNEALKDVRAILDKAGPKLIESFDGRFTPAPSTVDRLTVYLPPVDLAGARDFDFVFILAATKPFDRDKCLKQLGRTRLHKGRIGGFYADEEESMAVRFLDEKTLAFGNVSAIQRMVDFAPPQKPGPLTPALELAAGTRPVVASFNVTALPPELLQEVLRQYIPDPLHPLFTARTLVASFDLEGDGHVHAQAIYANTASADAAEKAVGAAMELAKGLIADTRKELLERVLGDGTQAKIEDFPEAAAGLFGLGALQHLEDILKTQPVKRSGDTLTATIALPSQFKSLIGAAGLAAAMTAPAVGRIRDAANRITSSNNLKQIGLALHNYASVENDSFPPAAIIDWKGKPQLSWRVMILPYIEQEALYKEFHLDEPWDSEHNKKLIEKMPKTYAIPNKPLKPGHTHYRVFVGNGALWDWLQGTPLGQISDGLSNTILAVEAEEAVPWTKPDELEFDPTKPLPKFSKFFKSGFHALFADGSVHFIRHNADEKNFKAMITKAGGEIIDRDK